MPPAFVQGATTGYTNSGTFGLAFPSGNTLGNLIIVFGSNFGSAATISDTNSNSYSQLSNLNVADPTHGYQPVWYAFNCASGANTVTVVSGALASAALLIAEYSGISTTSPLDQSGTNSGSGGTTWTGPSLTTTHASELLLVIAYASPSGGPTTISSPFTADETTTAGSFVVGILAENIVSSTGTYQATGAYVFGSYGITMATFIGASASFHPDEDYPPRMTQLPFDPSITVY